MSRAARALFGAFAFACVLEGGCREATAPVSPRVNGSFVLTKLNQRALPDTLAVAPPSGFSGGPACAIIATSGSLRLDSLAGKFTIVVNAKNCAGTESVLLTETGSYTQDGPTLTLTEPYPDHIENLGGRVDTQSIVIKATYEYTFAR